LTSSASPSASSSSTTLVVWGERDPYLSTNFAQAYAEALPDAEMDLIPGAGHWPWMDDARVIDRVVDFLG
jgi:pimeloyl-ACP methyl ester carboxylesterase